MVYILYTMLFLLYIMMKILSNYKGISINNMIYLQKAIGYFRKSRIGKTKLK